jgi:hypothetical protein
MWIMSVVRLARFLQAFVVSIGFTAFSAQAGTIVHVLIKADKVENAATLAEKVHSMNYPQCKAQAAVHLRFNEIVAVLECDGADVGLNGAMAAMRKVEAVESVMVFSVQR